MEVSRADLAYWVSATDALAELQRLALESDTGDHDSLQEESLEMEMVEEDGEDFFEGLSNFLNPAAMLPGESRINLTATATARWERALPVVEQFERASRDEQAAKMAVIELGKHFGPGQRVDAALKRQVSAQADKVQAATEIIGIGLALREGVYLGGMSPYDRDILEALKQSGGRVPPGISVCESCMLVFRPVRKHAAICGRCHSNPATPANGFETLPNRGYVVHAPFASMRVHYCEVCGQRFNPTKRNAKMCGETSRCRQAKSRAKRNQP